VNASGVYTITVTDTANGCSATDTVTVLSDTTPPVADAGSIQGVGCGVPTANLDGSASSSGLNITYNWTTVGGNIVSGGTSTGPTVDQGGLYTITVTNTTNGCTSTDTVSVISVPSPDASFTPSPSSGIFPLLVNFTNNSTNATTYFWDFGDGTNSVLTTPPADTYNAPGTYTVMLIASNGGACPDTTYATIVVFDEFTLIIPNVFTPNGDNTNDLFTLNGTGVASIDAAIYDRWGLKLYQWTNLGGGWDGRTSAGAVCSDGTYYYIITATGQDGTAHTFTGFLQLTR
jgi:gliding motility-associated-like protein